MSNFGFPLLAGASITTCALFASTAAFAGTLTYTGTDCTASPACATATGALGMLTLPVNIAFTDTFSTGETPTTDKWSFTIPAANAAATGSGVEFGADGTTGTITSFRLYTSLGALVEKGNSGKGKEVFVIPTTTLAAGSYILQILASGTYSGTLSATSVPLPASAWLMMSGVAGLLVLARRRRDPMVSGSSAG
jgi:hypothetical protein